MSDRRSRMCFQEMQQVFNRLETEHPGLGEGVRTDGESYMNLVTPRLGISVEIKANTGSLLPMVQIRHLDGRGYCLHRHLEDGKPVPARVHGLMLTKMGNPDVGNNCRIWNAHLQLSGRSLSSRDSCVWVETHSGDKFLEIEVVTVELERLMRALLNAPERATLLD
jgi:hypothetical protein